jgi:hypothetical protein
MKHMKTQILSCALAATLSLGLSRPLMKAGLRTGSLSGEVTDPSGAVVPGAKILVSGDHWSKTLVTNEFGQYVFAGLAPGVYDVLVRADGLAPFGRVGLVVSTGRNTEMDAILHLPILKQAIMVTAAASPTVGPTHAGR